MPSDGQATSKLGTTWQTPMLLKLSLEDAEFLSVTTEMACTQNEFL